MLIHGIFRDKNDTPITVRIITGGDTVAQKEIGTGDLKFGTRFEIKCECEDTFEHVIMQNASIELKTKNYIGGTLFPNNARDIKVDIIRNNVNIFSGYAEPCTFQQPFATIWDFFTVNCTDALTVLKYSNYKNVTAGTYNTVKTAADMVTFKSILQSILSDVLTDTGGSVFYDNSKGISSGHESTIFDNLSVSELVMFGESYDDVWTKLETLEEMLRYLNLHIIQWGTDFYIFDWDTIKNGVNTWTTLLGSGSASHTSVTTAILNSSHSSSNSNITISDVYNQVQVECDVENQETVISSPMDDDELENAYTGKAKYCTEFISEGNGESAWEAFQNMVAGNATSYDAAKQVDWYVQIMKSAAWNLWRNNSQKMDTLFSSYQTDVLKVLEQNRLTPLLLNLGKVEKQVDVTDNSVTSKIDMSQYLVISVNGNWRGDDSQDSEDLASISPSESEISAKNYSHGIVEYIGNSAGGAFSPVDSSTTNYLVFSGKLCLMPPQWETDRFRACQNGSPSGEDLTRGYGFHQTVPSDNNDYGRYYTRKFYTNDGSTFLSTGKSLSPFTSDKSNHLLQYNYSGVGDGTDTISKLAVLECELIIGDKRCVEINMDASGNSEFVWVDKNSGVQQTYVDENGNTQTYLKKTFSLGVNPKIGDRIVGDEYSLQNTVSYTQNIDAEGTAIPIRMSDALSGQVEFRILGPVNQTWNDITRRHPSFWRHTKWAEAAKSVLSHTENIWIKDFECKLYSDAGSSTNKDKDLVYCSNETQKYTSAKDDITFKMVTQLTAAEASSMGVPTATPLNAVINTSTHLGQTSLYNARTGETAKAEEHYVDQYYREYSTPKLIYDIDIHDDDVTVDFRNKFSSSVLGKTFFIQAWSRDLKYNSVHLKLKEV